MDIEEMKKYTKNKIEADDLIKQVRQRIKETIWDKQNKREGFSESFQPLISQFEKPEDSKKKIFSLKTRKCCVISWLLQKVSKKIRKLLLKVLVSLRDWLI